MGTSFAHTASKGIMPAPPADYPGAEAKRERECVRKPLF